MTSRGRLADFLRVRRERLSPEDVGLAPGDGTRRVPGLRREEVAVLAGVSTNYYLRLEHGRDTHPSDQVLAALARALRLDAVATAHLHALAHPAAVSGPVSVVPRGDVVNRPTRWLIDSWPMTAAVVHNRYIDVIASNPLARALNPNFRVGVNSVTSLFLDPGEREFHREWEGLAARSVALLRATADSHLPDMRLEAIVAEGSTSAQFREFWHRHDVVQVGSGQHDLRHPIVGDLTLHYTGLPLSGTDGQSLFLYSAEPGSASEEALQTLAQSGWD